MSWLWQAIALFAVTNIDDLIVLALFFARARAAGAGSRPVVLGQYLGFIAILILCLAGAVGAGQLPDRVIGYLGLVPILLGGWALRSGLRRRDDAALRPAVPVGAWWAVAGVTLSNSGDNIGVYVPAFAGRSAATLVGFAAVFLVLVGLWCLAGWLLTGHPAVIAAAHRWGAVLTPVALIAIGCVILVSHGTFG
ncbi:MAG: cadmium resistance transporter [Jatrophihabitantaceae bacterium]